MSKNRTASVSNHQPEITFGDGAIDEFGTAYISSFLTDPSYENTPHSRMWTHRRATWVYHDLDFIVKSVIRLTHPKPAAFALGQDGIVSIAVPPGAFTTEVIADAGTGKGKYGYVHRLREIAGTIYVCGHSGQVYKRTAGGWVHIDQGLLKPTMRVKDLISLYDIDGTSDGDIYVVGLDGILCHYDGSKWSQLDSPTNCPLERVECVSPRQVYLAGGNEEKGLLFVGNKKDGWQRFEADTANGFWGLTIFQGTPFVCSQHQLFTLRGDALVEVKPDLNPPIAYHRLASNADIMWSIGINDLAVFDGMKWARVIHLDAM
jgi:hypothetical protein